MERRRKTHRFFRQRRQSLYLTLADKSRLQQIADAPRTVRSPITNGRRKAIIWRSVADRASNNGGVFKSVYIYDVNANKLNRVTDPMFNSYNPAFDPSGDYLYFLSDREFAPQISRANLISRPIARR
jgi:tricorn protease-like protein